jgi:hypothetical protein
MPFREVTCAPLGQVRFLNDAEINHSKRHSIEVFPDVQLIFRLSQPSKSNPSQLHPPRCPQVNFSPSLVNCGRQRADCVNGGD